MTLKRGKVTLKETIVATGADVALKSGMRYIKQNEFKSISQGLSIKSGGNLR
jgi:hypothetical protein